MIPRLAYVVTEDWAFYRHRLPMARAARDAGFDVHVLTRVVDRRCEIEREGFTLHPLEWQRSRISPAATLSSVRDVRKVLAAIRPDVVHNVALKPALIGSLAATGLNRGMSGDSKRGLGRPGVVNSINGLGSAFLATSLKGRAIKTGLSVALPLLLNRAATRTIVQNPEDRAAVEGLGVRPERVVLVAGSGVETDVLLPLPEPTGIIRAAFVGRMLEDKGVRPLVEAHRMLRGRGIAIELLLAGEPDAENPTSITEAELEAWGREPGIKWLGHVEHIRDVWETSAIAVLPSRREGLPKSLLEAAAFGRPMVATDAPGCREIAVHGETGLLVPIDDARALADAIAQLAASPDVRARMGAAARSLTEQRFSAAEIGRQTVEVYRTVMREGQS